MNHLNVFALDEKSDRFDLELHRTFFLLSLPQEKLSSLKIIMKELMIRKQKGWGDGTCLPLYVRVKKENNL